MPGDFTQTPVELLSDPRLRDCDRTVYAGLVSFADYGTWSNCHPSVAGVAERTARSRPAAVDAIRRLVETGWVTRHPRKTRDGDSDTTEYRFPKQRFTAEVGRQADLPRSAGLPTSVGTLTDGRSAHLPTVGQHADHDLEPLTESHLPREPQATQAPLVLEPKEPKARKPRTVAQEPPTIEDTRAHFREYGGTDAEADETHAYWESMGWQRKGGPIRNWKATCRTRVLQLRSGSSAGATPMRRPYGAAPPTTDSYNRNDADGWEYDPATLRV